MRRFAVTLAATTILAMSVPANAQDDAQETAAFRVELGNGRETSNVPATYAWLETIGACSTTCGTGTRTTSYQCQNIANFDYTGIGYGVPEDEAYCSATAGEKPADSTSSCTVYSGCTYDWVKPPVQQTPIALGSNPVGRVGCGYVHQVFSPYCQRRGGSANVIMGAEDHAFCSGDRPDYNDVASGNADALGYDRNTTQTGSCTPSDHDWNRGEWGPWSNTCSATAVRTRSISCTRRFDGTTQPDARCDQTQDHAASQTQAVYSGCSYAKGPTVTNTGPWANGCSANTTRTLTYNCRRSDGTTVAASECTSRGVSLTETDTGSNFASCTYAWTPNDTTTGWGASSNTCSSSATQTRSVVCRRSDGTTVTDSNCTGTRPASTRTVTDYSTCSYTRGPTVTNTGPWASGCSSNTTRTLTYNCRRSDGTTVAATECTSRGVSLTETDTGANYASCSYAWSPNDTTTGWGSPSSTCSSSAIQTRSIVCRRSDGATVADSSCTGTRPASSRTIAIYSGCSYTRGTTVTNTGPWASGCSSNTTRTLTYNCRRSDGTDVAASECTSRGVNLTQTETGSNYASCSYAWNPNDATTGWGASSNTCSGSATQTRSVVCRRGDGATVGDSNCTGTRPASSRTIADYSGCSYARGTTVTNTGPWASGCSSSTSRTLTYNCRRSDGATVAASECTSRGISLTQTDTGSNYASCTYAWNPNNTTSGWGASSSTCSGSATQTRSVTCRRSDGATVADSNCTAARPASTRTVADYTGCGYARGTVTNTGPWASGCSGNTSRTLTYNCRRSDGTIVGDSECTNRNIALTQSQSGTNYAGCSYARGSTVTNTGPWASGCSASTTRTLTYNCRRSDGTDVSASECTNRSISLTQTQTGPNYASCSYSRGSAVNDTWSSGCSTNATRTITYACRRSDGVNVSASNCTNNGISVTSTSTGANYSSCTYTAVDGGVTACSNAGQRTRTWNCRRNETGQMVDTQTYCGRAPTQVESCTPPYPNPGGHLPGYVLGTYRFNTCSTQYDYGTQGTYGGINPQACRSTVATYTRKCQGSGNQTSNPGCTLMPYESRPSGPSGYPCDIICR